jgi:hypothetical protein
LSSGALKLKQSMFSGFCIPVESTCTLRALKRIDKNPHERAKLSYWESNTNVAAAAAGKNMPGDGQLFPL